MGKKRISSKASAPSVSLGRDNTIQMDHRWNMAFAGIHVAEDGSFSIAGRSFPVSSLEVMTRVPNYRENVAEFIRQVRKAKTEIRATITDVLTNMIWTVGGQPHLVSVVLAKDIRIKEPISGLLVFIQRQFAEGIPGRSILAVRPECFVELGAYLGMDRTPSPVSVAGMYMVAWTIPDDVADQLLKAYGAPTRGPMFFEPGGFPVGSRSEEIMGRPTVEKPQAPTGKEFRKLSRSARNKLLQRKLKASRASKK